MIANSNWIRAAAITFACCTFASFVVAEDTPPAAVEKSDELASDLKAMQGHWIMKPNPSVKFEWDVEGNQSTMSVFQNSQLVYKQVNKFNLKKVGPIKISEWETGDILAGERKGQKIDSGKLIYRMERDHMIQVMGMLENDNLPFNVQVLQREPATPEPAK